MTAAGPAPGTPEPEPQETGTGPGAGERSVVIHGNNHAPLTTGDHSPITITTMDTGPLPPVDGVPAAAGPVGITVHVPLFVGRERELARLEQALATGPGAVVQAVHGLGGIGKSALAARYVALHAGRYTQVVWITAEDAAGIEAGLRRFALALEPKLAALPSEALAERATAWLASHHGWLLVLDNVTSPNDISTLLSHLGAGGGRFLATSRRSAGWNRIGAAPVRLDVLRPGEALALLARTVGTTPGALDGGDELCAELGFLPLAITQAGAYIAQNQPGYEPGAREYLRLLADHPAHLYATGDEDTDSERTIARTWNITLDRLADDPLAGQILRILAWYAPDQIPTGLLDPLAPQPGLNEAIGKLAAYSMLTRTPAGPQAFPRLTVHRLVQAVTRTPDPADPHRDPDLIAQARDRATTLLAAALPEDWDDPAAWPAWRRLIPHIDALADHTTPDTDTPRTSHILNQAGLFLDGQGSLTLAAGHLHRAHDGYHRVLGADHPATLASRNNLAYAYESAGDLGRADPPVRADPHRPAAGAGRRPPRHPDLPQQPRLRLPGGGGPGPGHPPVRADPHRPAAGAGRRPPRHPDLPQQPRLRLPGGGGPGPGHPPVRDHAGCLQTGAGRRTSDHEDGPRKSRCCHRRTRRRHQTVVTGVSQAWM